MNSRKRIGLFSFSFLVIDKRGCLGYSIKLIGGTDISMYRDVLKEANKINGMNGSIVTIFLSKSYC